MLAPLGRAYATRRHCVVIHRNVLLFAIRQTAFGAEPLTLRFDISAYRVEGNSLLKQKQIQVLPRVVLRPSPKRNEVDANVEVERFGYRLALSELGDRIDTFAGYVLAGGSRR